MPRSPPPSPPTRPLAESSAWRPPPPHLRRAAAIAPAALPERFPAIHAAAEAPSIDEIMAVRIAAELDNESFASAGAVSPLANVAYRLAKATHAPDMIMATFSCGHVDIAPSPLILSLVEGLDAATAAAHAGGDDTYAAYYQAGAVTHEIIGAAQIDRRGRVNNLAITRRSGGFIRLPGQGGMADVANMHRDYALYVTRHSPLAFVEAVDVASSGRGLADPARCGRGPAYRSGRALVFSDLCVFRLDPDTGLLEVVELMPGVTRDRVAAETGFAVSFAADCADVALPDAEALDMLRHRIDPLGLRRLEFVAARDRGALIDAIIAADRALIDQLGGTSP